MIRHEAISAYRDNRLSAGQIKNIFVRAMFETISIGGIDVITQIERLEETLIILARFEHRSLIDAPVVAVIPLPNGKWIASIAHIENYNTKGDASGIRSRSVEEDFLRPLSLLGLPRRLRLGRYRRIRSSSMHTRLRARSARSRPRPSFVHRYSRLGASPLPEGCRRVLGRRGSPSPKIKAPPRRPRTTLRRLAALCAGAL